MGFDLYITRNEFWAVSQTPITKSEWLTLVENDPELELVPEMSDTFAEWHGDSLYDQAWLDWSKSGYISTKWPDTALYQKMLSIAKQLGAKVQDEDGTNYPVDADWEFTPDT